MKGIFKKMLPHVAAVIVFAVVSLVYFSPLLDGKRLDQYDIKQAGGNAKEVIDFRKKTGEEALWTNSVFGGMPAYQISVQYHHNILSYVNKALTGGLPAPAYMLFIAMLGFYVMLLCFGVNSWLSIVGAFAYGFSSYFLIIIGAGHNTKMKALEYMPPIIGGLYLAYSRRKIWVGVTITCLALGLQLLCNHLQITYYTALVVLIFLIFELVHVIKAGQYSRFIKTSAAMIIALVLAVGANITNMLLTAESTSYTTRGQSDLSDETGDQTKGLDKSYILNDYSYGIAETMNLFIPNFLGGASIGEVGTNSAFYEALVEHGLTKQQAAQACKQVPTYWGDQRSTSGPMYIGAVVVFLFVLGLFVVKGRIKWWLVTATCLSVMLAWGKHFPFLSNLFIDYFPLYNKFRTVSMILVITELAVPLLGILAVKELFANDLTAIDKQKALKRSFFITGGVALFFVLLPGLFFDFTGPKDDQLTSAWGYPDWLVAALPDTREALMRGDSFRSLLFVTVAAAALWFVAKEKLKMMPACVILALLILTDLWTVDKRYLNDGNFVKAKEANAIQPTPADLAILRDTGLDYRVLNLAVDPFTDATTSYFHKSLGGYHGAKMKRYQELIEHRLFPEMNIIYSNLQSIKTEEDVAKVFANCSAINMLNTKYLIYNKDQNPIQNPDALGNAWFVSNIEWADNADAEMAAMKKFNPSKTAVINKSYQSDLEGFTVKRGSSDSVKLVQYAPNRLVYEYQSQDPQLVVFSEIFYDKGWNAYIDGEPKPYVRADYVLRAMVVPGGKHQIEFRFEPKSYALGEKISLAGSIGIVLLVLGVITKELYDVRRNRSDNRESPDGKA